MNYVVITYLENGKIGTVLGPYESQLMAVTVRDNHRRTYNTNAIVRGLLRRNPYE